MKIVLSDTRKVMQFACILRYLKNISSDIEILINKDRLYTQGMDTSHVSLFELNLKNTWFNLYSVDEDIRIGINCELIFKILNSLNDSEIIEILYDLDDGDYLYIILYTPEGERGIRKEFKIPLMNIDSEILSVPDTDYTVDLQMVSSEFSTLIDELKMFGDILEVNCSDDIKLVGKGDMGEMKALIKEDDIIMYAIEEDATLHVQYPMSYIYQMTMFSKVNKKVNIHFSENLPMKIQYDMDDMLDEDEENEDYEAANFIRFFLAPKIEDC
tara:strand:+ start:1247 stop:2059 length:813 start_codon:yes stop_codon:yes gene_type:complete